MEGAAETPDEGHTDILSMSDAAIAEMSFDQLEVGIAASTTQEEEQEASTTPELQQDVEEEAADTTDVNVGTSDEQVLEEGEEELEQETGDAAPPIEKDEEIAGDTAEEQMAQLLAPFRANGKDMQVDSVEDARTLMQMGANYNKKMAAIKPNLKLMKMLENNGLLDESKLSFLIDLDKKDPEAIKKYLIESKVDPDTLDLEEQNTYKPNTYTVSDSEVALDGILEEIQDTDSFDETINILSNKWDASSKQVLIDQPEIIKHINAHVASGIYQQISDEVTKQKMFGKLRGLSDIEAYKAVGDAMHVEGKFNDSPTQQTPEPKVKVTLQKTPKTGAELRSRKKAAGSTQASPKAKKPAIDTINILALSDEEIMQLGDKRFM